MKIRFIIIGLLSLIYASDDYLQWDNHPELNWETIETVGCGIWQPNALTESQHFGLCIVDVMLWSYSIPHGV